jgi:hypothetical protein
MNYSGTYSAIRQPGKVGDLSKSAGKYWVVTEVTQPSGVWDSSGKVTITRLGGTTSRQISYLEYYIRSLTIRLRCAP